MALLKGKTEEEKLLREQEKRGRAEEKERERKAAERERVRQAFLASPVGLARAAFDRGDQVFQYELDVQNVKATVLPMVTAKGLRTQATNASDVLSAVCDEGWELVNGSFVFLQTGSESRDKFLASGQQIAVSGTTVGYYLFKRNEGNRREKSDPWDARDVASPERADLAMRNG